MVYFFKGGSLNDFLIIGGTVLEMIAPVSPCHSLVQNFIVISFHLSLKNNFLQYILRSFQYILMFIQY